jgi:hypothetical protein
MVIARYRIHLPLERVWYTMWYFPAWIAPTLQNLYCEEEAWPCL